MLAITNTCTDYYFIKCVKVYLIRILNRNQYRFLPWFFNHSQQVRTDFFGMPISRWVNDDYFAHRISLFASIFFTQLLNQYMITVHRFITGLGLLASQSTLTTHMVFTHYTALADISSLTWSCLLPPPYWLPRYMKDLGGVTRMAATGVAVHESTVSGDP